MPQEKLVTQGELAQTIEALDALANNLNEHVNQSLSKAHGWSILNTAYLDSGGIYHTDFGQTGFIAIPGLFNTGVNADGTLAAPGSADQHWTLILSADSTAPGPNAFVSSPISSAWSANGPNSQWISPLSDGSKKLKKGSYKYRITFNLSGLNPASAVVKGSWVSDNNTTAVILNGVTTGFTGPDNHTKEPQAGSSFLFNTGFVPGVNTLDFIVNNSGSQTGIRVEVSGTASAGGVSVIPTIFGTGLNAGGSPAVGGTVDVHWTLIQSAYGGNPGPNALVVNPLDNSWGKNTLTSQWIGPVANGQQSVPSGTYAYRTTFDLTGYSSVIVKGSYMVDDSLTKVLLNGVQITIPAGNKTTPTSFLITTGFLAGVNTLDFYTHNGQTHTGFKADLSGTGSKAGSGLTSHVLRLTIDGNVFYIPAQASGGLDGTPDPTIPPYTGIISPQSADPATDLTVGSPTSAKLITTFASALKAISDAAAETLDQHAGSPAEDVHGGLTWQPDSIFTTAAYLVGRRSINIHIGGVSYKIVADTNQNGPIN